MGGEREELRPSRTGSLFLAYDLKRYKAEARAQVLQQSLYWAGWVTALAPGHVAGVSFPPDSAHRATGARSRSSSPRDNLAARSGLEGAMSSVG